MGSSAEARMAKGPNAVAKRANDAARTDLRS